MKRLFAGLAFVAIMAVSSLSSATTWTDYSLDNKLINSSNTSYTHTYDITDGINGFVPGTDLALLGTLRLNFQGLGWTDFALLDIENVLPNTVSVLNVVLPNYLLVGAMWSINDDGKLDLNLAWKRGEFTLYDSILCVTGCDNSPAVPEPGTIMLLGAGFLGLAVYTKRRRTA